MEHRRGGLPWIYRPVGVVPGSDRRSVVDSVSSFQSNRIGLPARLQIRIRHSESLPCLRVGLRHNGGKGKFPSFRTAMGCSWRRASRGTWGRWRSPGATARRSTRGSRGRTPDRAAARRRAQMAHGPSSPS
uniref:Uncharacterized protein n=1 Tax=Setaria italica TaxID=4555 RepID=K4A3L8_SETIT